MPEPIKRSALSGRRACRPDDDQSGSPDDNEGAQGSGRPQGGEQNPQGSAQGSGVEGVEGAGACAAGGQGNGGAQGGGQVAEGGAGGRGQLPLGTTRSLRQKRGRKGGSSRARGHHGVWRQGWGRGAVDNG